VKSVRRGKTTSAAEVVHISSHGFWLFFEPLQRELFLPFSAFPWFADATIRQLSTIEVERDHVVRWPELDVDLDVSRIEEPERYPLVSRQSRQRRRAAAVATSRRKLVSRAWAGPSR
jgi:hypothetical protein